MMSKPVPVIVFAYSRPKHLARVLQCLKQDSVPLVYAFCDGAKNDADRPAVNEVRSEFDRVDWCDLRLTARTENLGLGKNVMEGVSEVASKHDCFIVVEDDLISVPGTYEWVCSALAHYRDCSNVMSVTAWTHPSVNPVVEPKIPYLDGRPECWYWATWSKAWSGMQGETAIAKMLSAEDRGVRRDAYGHDLPGQAQIEQTRNIWAVRWMYHHLMHGGLCVRPPWSMVEHIGFDASGTNVVPADAGAWANPSLPDAPSIPSQWPRPIEHPDCRWLWRKANPGRLGRMIKSISRRFAPA